MAERDWKKWGERLRERKMGEILDGMRREWLKDQMKEIDKREKRQIGERKFFEDNFIGIILLLGIVLAIFLSRNC